MGETIIYRQLCFKNGELVHKEIVEITKLRLLEIHGIDNIYKLVNDWNRGAITQLCLNFSTDRLLWLYYV